MRSPWLMAILLIGALLGVGAVAASLICIKLSDARHLLAE